MILDQDDSFNKAQKEKKQKMKEKERELAQFRVQQMSGGYYESMPNQNENGKPHSPK